MTGEVEAGRVRSMHPQKFAMWLFLVSVTMIFISLSSGFIVQKSAKGLLLYELPQTFLYTSIIHLISSVTMQMAYDFARRNDIAKLKASLIATFLLSLAFMWGQWIAWEELVSMDMHFVNDNPLESFIYIFTGVHVAHLIGAVIFLLIVLNKSFTYQVHSKSLVRIEMCATFWHFLGGLWLYLYLFLIFNN